MVVWYLVVDGGWLLLIGDRYEAGVAAGPDCAKAQSGPAAITVSYLSTINSYQPPSTTKYQPPTITTHQPSTTNHHQPPIIKHQPLCAPPNTNHQPYDQSPTTNHHQAPIPNHQLSSISLQLSLINNQPVLAISHF